MRTSLILPSAISVIESAPSFKDAVVEATSLLVTNNFVRQGYVAAVLANLENLGPYFAVAPEIAIAHSAPSDLVIAPGLALVKLNQSVLTGHQLHSQARLIFALATPDPTAHLELMGELASKLSDSNLVNSMLNASATSVIWEILNS